VPLRLRVVSPGCAAGVFLPLRGSGGSVTTLLGVVSALLLRPLRGFNGTGKPDPTTREGRLLPPPSGEERWGVLHSQAPKGSERGRVD